MASAKQLAARRRFASFVKAHGRAPRKGESLGASRTVKKMPGKTRRAVARIRKTYHRARSSPIGRRVHVKSLGAGAVAGAIAPYSTQVAGEYGPGLTLAAVGVAMDNDVLQTIGAVSLAGAAVRQFAGAPAASGAGIL